MIDSVGAKVEAAAATTTTTTTTMARSESSTPTSAASPSSSSAAAAAAAASTSSSATSWRKISLPLPNLLPHLTLSFRGAGREPTEPEPASASAPASASKTGRKAAREWTLRRQKTYDSPGCLGLAAIGRSQSTTAGPSKVKIRK